MAEMPRIDTLSLEKNKHLVHEQNDESCWPELTEDSTRTSRHSKRSWRQEAIYQPAALEESRPRPEPWGPDSPHHHQHSSQRPEEKSQDVEIDIQIENGSHQAKEDDPFTVRAVSSNRSSSVPSLSSNKPHNDNHCGGATLSGEHDWTQHPTETPPAAMQHRPMSTNRRQQTYPRQATPTVPLPPPLKPRSSSLSAAYAAEATGSHRHPGPSNGRRGSTPSFKPVLTPSHMQPPLPTRGSNGSTMAHETTIDLPLDSMHFSQTDAPHPNEGRWNKAKGVSDQHHRQGKSFQWYQLRNGPSLLEFFRGKKPSSPKDLLGSPSSSSAAILNMQSQDSMTGLDLEAGSDELFKPRSLTRPFAYSAAASRAGSLAEVDMSYGSHTTHPSQGGLTSPDVYYNSPSEMGSPPPVVRRYASRTPTRVMSPPNGAVASGSESTHSTSMVKVAGIVASAAAVPQVAQQQQPADSIPLYLGGKIEQPPLQYLGLSDKQLTDHPGFMKADRSPSELRDYIDRLYCTILHKDMALSHAKRQTSILQRELDQTKCLVDRERRTQTDEVDQVKEQVVKMEENFLLWRTKVHNDQMTLQEEYLQERLDKQAKIEELEESLCNAQEEVVRLRERLLVLEYEDGYVGLSSFLVKSGSGSSQGDQSGEAGFDSISARTAPYGPMTVASHKRRSTDFKVLEERTQFLEGRIKDLVSNLGQERESHQTSWSELEKRMSEKCVVLERAAQAAKMEVSIYSEMMHEIVTENDELRSRAKAAERKVRQYGGSVDDHYRTPDSTESDDDMVEIYI